MLIWPIIDLGHKYKLLYPYGRTIMKKLTNTLCLILMIFLTFSLAGCNAKDSDDAKAQAVIKKYVNTYYTIDKNDIETYGKIIAGSKMTQTALMEFDEVMRSAQEKFKSLTTDAAYHELTASRMSYGRIKGAYTEKYYVTVKDIKLEKYSEDKEKQMLVYYYEIEFTQTSISGNETKSIKDKKQITVAKVNDDWKVEHFSANGGYQY
jgi:hypothetical protein